MKLIKINIFFLTFLAVFLFNSCTTSKPEIVFGFIKLVLYQEENGHVEHFSFFILPEDEDGIENLDELFLFHDRENFRWHLRSDEWVTYTLDGRIWIGTRSLAVQEGSLPRGVFRAVLVNKGGERAERTFTFDAFPRFPFPEFTIENGNFSVNSQWPSNRLVGYDRAGSFHSIIELPSLSGSVSQLNLPAAVRTVALWAEDEAFFSSAFTNVVLVR